MLGDSITAHDPQGSIPVSSELIEQRLGVPQDGRIQALGEPAVHRREQIPTLHSFALVAPEAGEAGGGAKSPESGVLFM